MNLSETNFWVVMKDSFDWFWPEKKFIVNPLIQIEGAKQTSLSEHNSLTVSMLACHAGDPGSNPAWGDEFSN